MYERLGRGWLIACGCALAVFVAPGTAQQQEVKLELIGCSVGASNAAEIFDINFSTGEATRPRPTGIHWLMGITFGPDGTLYGLTTFASDPPNALLRIDPRSGTATTIGATGMASLIEGDLAFHPTTRELYGVNETAGGGQSLFRIDVASGAGTLVGDMGPNTGSTWDISALAFDGAGHLYAIDTTRDVLLAIDHTNARVLRTTPLSTPLGGSAGMAYHHQQEAFYVADGYTDGTNTLYRLDPHSARLTPVGPLRNAPGGMAGLAFVWTAPL